MDVVQTADESDSLAIQTSFMTKDTLTQTN